MTINRILNRMLATRRFRPAIALAAAGIAVSSLATPGLAHASRLLARPSLSTATIHVGTNPWAVAVDPVSHTAYVTNENSGTVSVINEAADTVTATITVGNSPQGLAVDPNTSTVWVANNGSGTVSVIDEHTNTVIKTIPVASGGNYQFPDTVVVDAPTNIVYVGMYFGGIVQVSDQTYVPQPWFITPGGHTGITAVDQATNTLFAAGQDSGAVQEVNTVSKTLTANLTGIGLILSGETDMALENTSAAGYPGYLYVCEQQAGGDRIAVFNNMNTGVGQIWAVIHTPASSSYPNGVAVNTTTNTLYIVLPAKSGNTAGGVAIVDGASGKSPKITATITVGKNPGGIAIDPGEGSTGTVFVANFNSNTITAFTA